MVSWPHSKNSFFSSSAHRRRWIEWRTLKTRRRKILDRNRKVKYWFVAERWTLFFYSSKAQIFYQMKISPITLSLPSFFCFVQPRQQAKKDEEKKEPRVRRERDLFKFNRFEQQRTDCIDYFKSERKKKLR